MMLVQWHHYSHTLTLCLIQAYMQCNKRENNPHKKLHWMHKALRDITSRTNIHNRIVVGFTTLHLTWPFAKNDCKIKSKRHFVIHFALLKYLYYLLCLRIHIQDEVVCVCVSEFVIHVCVAFHIGLCWSTLVTET